MVILPLKQTYLTLNFKGHIQMNDYIYRNESAESIETAKSVLGSLVDTEFFSVQAPRLILSRPTEMMLHYAKDARLKTDSKAKSIITQLNFFFINSKVFFNLSFDDVQQYALTNTEVRYCSYLAIDNGEGKILLYKNIISGYFNELHESYSLETQNFIEYGFVPKCSSVKVNKDKKSLFELKQAGIYNSFDPAHLVLSDFFQEKEPDSIYSIADILPWSGKYYDGNVDKKTSTSNSAVKSYDLVIPGILFIIFLFLTIHTYFAHIEERDKKREMDFIEKDLVLIKKGFNAQFNLNSLKPCPESVILDHRSLNETNGNSRAYYIKGCVNKKKELFLTISFDEYIKEDNLK